MSAGNPYTVIFVCSGNICRSPIAEVVVTEMLRREGLGDRVVVRSAGLGAWHVGQPADRRALAVLKDNGFDGSPHRARQLSPDEIADADLVVALDAGHARQLRQQARRQDERKVRLLRSFEPGAAPGDLDVADPYYGDDAGFTTVLEQVRAAAPGLVAEVRAAVTAP